MAVRGVFRAAYQKSHLLAFCESPLTGLEPSTPSLPWRIRAVLASRQTNAYRSFSLHSERLICLARPFLRDRPEHPRKTLNLSPGNLSPTSASVVDGAEADPSRTRNNVLAVIVEKSGLHCVDLQGLLALHSSLEGTRTSVTVEEDSACRKPLAAQATRTINSASRVRFRPPLQRTFGVPPCGLFLRPTGVDSTYSRPVLAARGKLGGDQLQRQGQTPAVIGNCGLSLLARHGREQGTFTRARQPQPLL